MRQPGGSGQSGRVSAVILAGGLGSRMLPLSAKRPKHLLPVAGEPLIVHQLRRLAKARITDVALATAHHAREFEPTLGDGRRWGINLTYLHEGEPSGTGGALRYAWSVLQPAPGDSVVILNGDLVGGHDLRAHVAAHQTSGAIVTIHGREVDDARPFGLLRTASGELSCARTADAHRADGQASDAATWDREHGPNGVVQRQPADALTNHDAGTGATLRVTGFEEKPQQRVAGLVNAGTYVVSTRLADFFGEQTPLSLEREVFPRLAEQDGVRAYLDNTPFWDVGSPAALLEVNVRLAAGKPDLLIAEDAQVAASATVRDSLVMAGAHIAENAHVERSIVAPGAQIGRGAQVNDCVVADGAVVAAAARVSGQTLS